MLVFSLTAACASASKQAGLEGAAVGGGTTFAVCKALRRSTTTCGALAAVVGASAGIAVYKYAENLEERKKILQDREEDLNARLSYLKAVIADTESLKAGLEEHAEKMTRETDAVLANIQRNELTENERQEAQKSLDTSLETARKQIAAGQESLEEMKRFAAKRKATLVQQEKELDTQIKKFDQLLADASRNTEALASQRQRF